MRIPAHGLPADEIFARLARFRADDMPWRNGRTWAYVYDPGPEAEEVLKRAFADFLSENALDPTVFPSAMRLETEFVAMAAAHLGGGPETVGSFTSGGTESILLAVKSARDHARAHRPEVVRPELLLPSTAHAAFHKAADYLGLETVVVDVDPETYRADVAALRRAITSRTVMVVGSAVSYAHGVVDPIRELGALALEHDLWLHVDGCIGGFLLPYFRRLGADVPDFDFTVPGVRSISMDFHKYAFAAKGASVLLHRTREGRRHQIYACAGWTGYTVVNPTVQSTKSAGPLAAAWAILHFLGEEGYLAFARTMLETTRRMCAGIARVPGLRVLGEPAMNLVAFASTDPALSVFHVADELRARGWYAQPQLAYGSSPANVHLSINPANARWAEEFLADLAQCVEAARRLPHGEAAAAVRAALEAAGPGFAPDAAAFQHVLALAGIEGTTLPTRMATINEILNVLPPPMREWLLVEYVNELYAAPAESEVPAVAAAAETR